ncbi:hypothetical protein Asulf_00894 [Archaeoglobus sulfaticallidus PM70-1]|uniref:SHOCT domain-containing protein n=1 Tax=Archaeoglobus sulfaticallidus PM70-1 TaxID=387631 RepID=N0BK71_9EURY|nr:PH domain-containing protein [Archaeoglobus sulfaticallidus]AGK60901.1 hypothetical protein Asulf_00894 [Archaeoglobus sulfaticallidus PM70-1]
MVEVPPELSENLYPNEKVLFSVKKKLKTELKPKYLIVTDRRVIYLDQKILGRYELIDFPYEKLEFVKFKKGKIGAEFILQSEEGKTVKLSWMDKNEAKDAIEAIRDALNATAVEQISIAKKKGLLGEEWSISKPKETVARTLPMTQVIEKTTPQKEDPIEKLKKLKELYEAGVISKEEFEEKKKKLLDQI